MAGFDSPVRPWGKVIEGIGDSLSAEEVLVDVYGRYWVVQEKEEGRRCVTGSGTRRARNTQSITQASRGNKIIFRSQTFFFETWLHFSIFFADP